MPDNGRCPQCGEITRFHISNDNSCGACGLLLPKQPRYSQTYDLILEKTAIFEGQVTVINPHLKDMELEIKKLLWNLDLEQLDLVSTGSLVVNIRERGNTYTIAKLEEIEEEKF